MAQLPLSADRFELLGRVDRRIVASGRAALRLDATTLALDGDFKVDEGLIDFTRSDAPTLGDDVEVVRRPVAPRAARGARRTRGAAAPIARSRRRRARSRSTCASTWASKLRVRGRGLDAGLRGELHLTSPSGRLAVNGTLRAVDGTYQAYGQKLDIDRGVLSLHRRRSRTRASTSRRPGPNLDVRVGVLVTGTALTPRIRLFSEPEHVGPRQAELARPRPRQRERRRRRHRAAAAAPRWRCSRAKARARPTG